MSRQLPLPPKSCFTYLREVVEDVKGEAVTVDATGKEALKAAGHSIVLCSELVYFMQVLANLSCTHYLDRDFT